MVFPGRIQDFTRLFIAAMILRDISARVNSCIDQQSLHRLSLLSCFGCFGTAVCSNIFDPVISISEGVSNNIPIFYCIKRSEISILQYFLVVLGYIHLALLNSSIEAGILLGYILSEPVLMASFSRRARKKSRERHILTLRTK